MRRPQRMRLAGTIAVAALTLGAAMTAAPAATAAPAPPAAPAAPAIAQSPTAGTGTTYYVAADGNDANSGLSPSTPFRTIAKVDQKTFQPGDSILFRAGDTWTDAVLHPNGNGTAAAPITIGRYGDASAAAPSFNAGSATITMSTYDLVKSTDSHLVASTETFSPTVYLRNQQYWTIRDLDISNHVDGSTTADDTLRTGILIMNSDAGTLHDVDVVDNTVHDVLGDVASKTYWGGAGIMYTVMLKGPSVTTASNYAGVLIQGNYVRNTNRQGITTNSRQNLRPDIDTTGDLADAIARNLSPWFPSTGVVIRDNYVQDVAGDGILPQVTQNALVEDNTVAGFNERSGGASAGMWAWDADGTLFQYNEASGGHGTQDGEGYDLDYGQTGTIFQYNYSHDNDGGFMLICGSAQGSDPSSPGHGVRSQNGIVRYNVSQNDHARSFEFSGYSDGALIYNNTIYQAAGVNANPIDFFDWNGTYPTSESFYNNVFDLQSAGPWVFSDGGVSIQGLTFDSNTVYGVHTTGEPSDAHKSTADPELVAPGTGATRTPVGGSYVAPDLDGYRLQSGSPDVGTGAVVETTSGRTITGTAANGGLDYWGDPVTPGVAPDRGADNRIQ